jgi:hypothetical protein
VHFKKDSLVLTDSGYLGLQKLHNNTAMPKKKSKKNPLSSSEKQANRQLSSQRVSSEHVISTIKRFKIVADRYRNRRKRFVLVSDLILLQEFVILSYNVSFERGLLYYF